MNKQTELAIVIPVHNHLELTRSALDNLNKCLPAGKESKFHTVVVDDGSSDGTSAWIKEYYPEVIVLHGDGNLWWSGAINMGAKFAIESLNAEYIILWNNDILFEPDYFKTLINIISKTDQRTIIGSKILVAENPELVWSMGGYFDPLNGKYGMFGYYEPDSDNFRQILNVDWLTGMGTIIHRVVIEDCGYWDQVNFPQYHGDSDFTYRAKISNHTIKVYPDLKIYNKVKHSGFEHHGKLKDLLNMLTDIRSKINFKKNLLFYKRHAKSIRAYLPLIKSYLFVFIGFVKWKLLGLWGRKKTV